MITNKREETNLTLHDFYYDLPEELIAQTPAKKRDGSRLMVIHRENGDIEHKIFHDIIDYLKPGDTLVVNNSKVIPARLMGIKEESGIVCELVLLRRRELDLWECLVRPGRRLKPGTKVVFGDGLMTGVIEETVEGGNRLVRFEYDKIEGDFFTVLDRVGQMPLPPYITEKLEDRSRYQTVYAKTEGSAAAPTAGLHFTPELLGEIKAKGIEVVEVMLHVGLGTFRPVKVEDIKNHEMHAEYIEVTPEAADIINKRRNAGGRTVCVGTTSCRTLESASDDNGIVHPVNDDTGIFIYPGYKFKAVDALVTNFHLPESTLLMLVSAFYNREAMLGAYKTAVEEKYRFFSFGDAMLIE